MKHILSRNLAKDVSLKVHLDKTKTKIERMGNIEIIICSLRGAKSCGVGMDGKSLRLDRPSLVEGGNPC